MGLKLTTGTPPALEEALARGVRDAQADDPLSPVGVLLGGTLQRPYLQRRLAELNDGIANVRFLMPSELAMEVGERAQVLAGNRPLPPLADRVLLREIAASREGGYFEPVKDTPGLADALHRLVRELRGAGYDAKSLAKAVDGACEVPEKAQAINEIFAEFLRRREGFYGPDDCMLSAEPKRAPWEALFVFGLWQAGTALTEVVIQLAKRLPVTVFAPLSGTEELDAAHAELRARLVAAGAEVSELTDQVAPGTALELAQARLFTVPSEPAPEDESLKMISGPDPAREVRAVARQCLAWAREGIRFHEMAIAYRHPDPYRSTIESVFQEAHVPLYLHEGTPMSERPLGRRVIALLELAESGFERRAVIDLLSDGKLPQATWEKHGKASASTWDRFSRRAGVVRGLEQWEQRLDALAERLGRSDRDWEREDAERVRSFLEFIRNLHSDLAGLPQEGSWSEHLEALDVLLHRYVDDPAPILDPLAGLGRFDALGARTTGERFRQAVVASVQNLRTEEVERERPGAFGLRGVNVLDVNSLRHLRFRAVAIVGLAERSFPSPPRPDPILLDHERERLNAKGEGPIPLRVRGADPEPLQFKIAIYAARERLLASYPRKGTESARPQLPSRFFRALAEAAVAKRVPAQEVDQLPTGLYTRVSGSRIGAQEPELSLSREEYDRTLLEHDLDLGRAVLTRAEPRFGRALEARRARLSKKLTEFDGVLGAAARDHLVAVFDPTRGVSPSLLESYASCPQRVFAGSVLRLRKEDEPEQIVRMSAGDRGTLLHRILERFLGGAPRKGEELLFGKSEEARLLAIAEQEFELCERRGQTGYPAIWGVDRVELVQDLKAWLQNERRDERFRELPEGAYEIRFGYGRNDSECDGDLSTDEPIQISAGKVKLSVSGRIDRLNWNPETKAFRVVDYKTGKPYKVPADGSLRGGEGLQLPIYMLAAARMLKLRPGQGGAEYHYSTRQGGFKRAHFDGTAFAARKADLEAVLAEMLNGMRAGVFPMAVRSRRDCNYCVAEQLCPTSRMRIIERKAGATPNQGLERIRAVE